MRRSGTTPRCTTRDRRWPIRTCHTGPSKPPKADPAQFTDADLSDWIFCFQSRDSSMLLHSILKWKQSRSEAWLLDGPGALEPRNRSQGRSCGRGGSRFRDISRIPHRAISFISYLRGDGESARRSGRARRAIRRSAVARAPFKRESLSRPPHAGGPKFRGVPPVRRAPPGADHARYGHRGDARLPGVSSFRKLSYRTLRSTAMRRTCSTATLHFAC